MGNFVKILDGFFATSLGMLYLAMLLVNQINCLFSIFGKSSTWVMAEFLKFFCKIEWAKEHFYISDLISFGGNVTSRFSKNYIYF